MSSIKKSNKKKNKLSFTKKCIILANIENETDLILLNSFEFMPLVKLYTSNLKQETFNYTKVKGALLLFKNKSPEKNLFYFRIYDSNNYSLQFNLEINADTKKNFIKIEPNFYCFNVKIGCIGFLFASAGEAEKFKELFDSEEIDQITKDEFDQYNKFAITDSDNIYLDVIDNLIEIFGKKYEIMTLGEKLQQKCYEVNDYLIFSGFLELTQLLGNMDYDYEDNVFNIFIDKKFDNKLFKKIFNHYDINKLYPLRILRHDYYLIYNKSNYVDLLVGHLMNNFKEQVEIFKKRKENKLNEKNQKISNNMERNSNIES